MKLASPPLAVAPAAASATVVIHIGHMIFCFSFPFTETTNEQTGLGHCSRLFRRDFGL
jgi:hypothetical protein